MSEETSGYVVTSNIGEVDAILRPNLLFKTRFNFDV